jgi:hypothetical protein
LASSSYLSSPSYRIFTIIYLEQIMSLRYIMLYLFCVYNIWYMWCYFPWQAFCTSTLVLSEACAQCPVWLFSVVLWNRAFQVSRPDN